MHIKYLKIIQIKSEIGIKKNHKKILNLLGLKGINTISIKQFNNYLKKNLLKIIYMVKCKNIYEII